jgi:hypothetical protein
MTRRVALALMALVTGVAMSTAVAAAHEGHEHKVMGTITMAAADHVMLDAKDGKAYTIAVTKETKVKSQPAMKVEDIKPGTRVVVTAVEQKDKSLTAKTIEVGAAPAAAR